jgi:hypothetical protein
VTSPPSLKNTKKEKTLPAGSITIGLIIENIPVGCNAYNPCVV